MKLMGAVDEPAAKERRVSDDVVMAVELDDLQEDGPEKGRQNPKRNLCEEAQNTSPGNIYKEEGLWHIEGIPDEADKKRPAAPRASEPPTAPVRRADPLHGCRPWGWGTRQRRPRRRPWASGPEWIA